MKPVSNTDIIILNRRSCSAAFYMLCIAENTGFFGRWQPYYKIDRLDIELYTDSKDMRLERKVEDILEKHGSFTKNRNVHRK